MKKSFYIFLFSVIGFSFLSAQEKSSEPIQKQSNTMNQQKLQKTHSSSQTKMTIKQPLSKSTKSTPSNESIYKKQAIKSKSMVDVKQSEAIEPKNSDN